MLLAINSLRTSNFLSVVERIKLKLKCFNIVAYHLLGGGTVVTIRQTAISVRQKPQNCEEFLKKKGFQSWKVQMPNNCIADMIPLSTAAVYWKYLNSSGKGNILTKLAQEMYKCLEEGKTVVTDSEFWAEQIKNMDVKQCTFPNRKISKEASEKNSSSFKQRVDSLEKRLGELEQQLVNMQVQHE